MGRERDRFWEYVEESDGHFLCKFCAHRFSGGITRIKSHLSGIRGRDIEICPKVPDDVQVAALRAIGAPMKEIGSVNFLNNAGERDQVISTSASRKKGKRLHQSSNLGKGKKDKSEVDKILAKFIIANGISLDLSKSPYLIDLLKSMAEFEPTYELPNSLALGTQLMIDIYEEAEEHIKNVKKFSTTAGCSFVMCNVVKNSKLECINIFAHTPVGLVYVQKIVVPEEGMTFDHFIDGIFRAIEFWGPRNVVQCILNLMDDDIVNSIKDFKDDNFFLSVQAVILEEYPWIYLNRCANREFGLLLILTYLTVPWIHKTTQLAQVIYKYLYEHDINLTPRKQNARNKEYSVAGLTRIAVEFFTLNSILEVEKELQVLQLPVASEFCEGPSHEDDVAKTVDNAIHSTEFWSRGRKVVRVLQSLFQVLDFIDGNGSTSGYLYEAMNRAEEALEQQCDADDQVHYVTIRKMFKKWRTRVVHPINAAAAFLNPAYFCSEKFTENTEMQKGLKLLPLFIPAGEQETLSKQVQLYRSKDPDLFSATAMKMLHTIHPRKWWECFGDHCPILQKLAIQILSQSCATPTCHLSKFQPNDLVDTFRMNMIMMEKYGTLKSQNWKPIDLDKISGLPEYAHEVVKQYFEEKYWSDGSDYCDLLVINNPNNRLISSSKSNDHDDLSENSNLDDWIFNLGELGNLDDLLDMLN